MKVIRKADECYGEGENTSRSNLRRILPLNAERVVAEVEKAQEVARSAVEEPECAQVQN